MFRVLFYFYVGVFNSYPGLIDEKNTYESTSYWK